MESIDVYEFEAEPGLRYSIVYYTLTEKTNMEKRCGCGCGETPRLPKHNFMKGHGSREWTNTPEERIKRSKRVSGDKNPAKREEVRAKISLSMKGKSNKKSGDTLRLKYKLGLIKNAWKGKHHSIETRKRWSKIRTGKPQPWRRGDLHPLKSAEVRARLSIIHSNPEVTLKKQKTRIENAKNRDEYHGVFTSKSQLKLYELIKLVFPDAKLNYPIQTKIGVRFADVYVPSTKTIYEYDGLYWHKNKLSDKIRDDELKDLGLTVIHFKEEKDKPTITPFGIIDFHGIEEKITVIQL
jgi:very-short-patch-repair endonuclease